MTASARWLVGPIPDLVFGCGAIYFVFFALLAFAGPELRAVLPPELAPLLILVTGVPHYGATLLRVYEHAADRHRYLLVSVLATALVGAAFVWGVYDFTVGALLLTVYLTWSPWHYAGQNYGIALLFLRRRGVEVTPTAKRLLYASFGLSFALTFVAFHAEVPDVAYAPDAGYDRSVYAVLPLGIPSTLADGMLLALGIAYAGSVVATLALLRRGASWRDLVPSALLVASQALWFVVPLLARQRGLLQEVEPFGTAYASYAFLWIAAAHSLQYVWITNAFDRHAHPGRARTRYWLRIWFAGAAIWVVPAWLFAPGMLGSVPYDAGLGALVAAAVNIHHFILDGAIWKLREGPIAQVLLRSQTAAAAPPTASALGTWTGRVLLGVGALAVCALAFGTIERYVGLALAAQRGDIARIEQAERRLAWLGQSSALVHVTAAMLQQAAGDQAAAERHAAAVESMHADYASLGNLAVYYQRAGRFAEAEAAVRRALALRPDSANLQQKLAWLLVNLKPPTAAQADEAVDLAQRAVAAAGEDADARSLYTLAEAYGAADRPVDAVRTGAQALDRARADGDLQLASLVATRLSAWRAAEQGR